MLREFHERMTAQIFACGGTVEKYIGDAIFAVFGVPDGQRRRCRQRAALRRHDAGGARRAGTPSAPTRGEPPLAIGIGLNYGPAVLGDVGSEHSMSFTVIGDTVNTASRLQGLTRELGTPLVVGDAVVQADRRRSPLPIALQDQGNTSCAAAAAPSASGRERTKPDRDLVPVGLSGHFTSGGSDIRIASMLPPVFRPNCVPRS